MFKINCITTNNSNVSIFKEITYKTHDKLGMLLTNQIGAKNFRLRQSKVGYKTDWHLSGDPTLISVLKGTLRIILQNEKYIDFAAGDLFIAADKLPKNIDFDVSIHGHKALVVGNKNLFAIHIKLDDFMI